MKKLQITDLMTLEAYARNRSAFRAKMMAHKKNRVVALGDDIALHFEDHLTMHYQVQEMLRTERIFEADGIQEELDTYNPLIPEGSDWRATMMIEYSDPEVRKNMLRCLVGIEDLTWVRVADGERVYAISNEDLERSTEDRTSAVHFMHFPLREEDVRAAKNGEPIKVGIAHEHYMVEVIVPENIRQSLVADLD